MLVQGDDNLMKHAGDRVNFRDDLLQLGFKSDSNYRNQLYEAEFCSSIPVTSKTGIVFVPKPGKVIAKLGYFIDPPQRVHPNQILNGVARGFENLRFIHLFDSLLGAVDDLCGGYKPYYVREDNSHKFGFDKAEWCELTTFDIMMRYGFDCGMYRDCCKALAKGELTHPYVICLMDRETDGPKMIYSQV